MQLNRAMQIKAAELGVTVGGPVQVDFAKIMERMRRIRAELSPNDSAERFVRIRARAAR